MPNAKKRKFTRPKRAMSALAIGSVIEGIGENGAFYVWFKAVNHWDIDDSGDFRHEDAKVTAENWQLSYIAHGGAVRYDVNTPGEVGHDLEATEHQSQHNFFEDEESLKCIHAVAVIHEGDPPSNEIHLHSINELLIIHPEVDDHIDIGDKQLSREDAEVAFKNIGEWLGYEIAS